MKKKWLFLENGCKLLMERIMIRGWKEPVFKKNYNFSLLHFKFNPTLTLIYLAHFEDVPCQSGVNHIFEG